jgi:hypothetical protein
MLHQELLQALADNKVGEDFERKLSEMWNLRDRAQRYARDVAPYFHPQLQAIKHDRRTADGQPLRPILVIEGYPSKPPALTNLLQRHVLTLDVADFVEAITERSGTARIRRAALDA